MTSVLPSVVIIFDTVRLHNMILDEVIEL